MTNGFPSPPPGAPKHVAMAASGAIGGELQLGQEDWDREDISPPVPPGDAPLSTN